MEKLRGYKLPQCTLDHTRSLLEGAASSSKLQVVEVLKLT
jgi:hypothetical protein